MKPFFAGLFCCFTSFQLFAQIDRVETKTAAPRMAVTFKPGTAELEQSSEPILERLKSYLSTHREVTLMRIEGNVSGTANSQALSEARALNVVRWLVAHGVDCKRLLAVGFGNSKATGATFDNRIGFMNVAMNGKLIRKLPTDGGGKIAGDPCKK